MKQSIAPLFFCWDLHKRKNLTRTSVVYLALAGSLISTILLSSCDGGKSPSDHGKPLFVENNIVFEREDGSIVTFDTSTFIWCGPWEAGTIPIETIHIMSGVNQLGQIPKSAWMLKAVIGDVVTGKEISFPNSFVWDQPRGAELFVYDQPNELSTHEEESSGSLIFQKMRCAGLTEVTFSIDAVIGSEFHDGEKLKVSGTFKAKIF
jgi:hypothetical protein